MLENLGIGTTSLVLGVFDRFVASVNASKQRKHERKMAELQLIANSNVRDEYARQLYLDRLLNPIEKAQKVMQNASKHGQWMADSINYYYPDHGLNEEQVKIVSCELRSLSISIAHSETLHDLKIVYEAASYLAHLLSHFKHRDRKYSIDRSIRKGILDPLNDCIGNERNFQRRLGFTYSDDSPSDLILLQIRKQFGEIPSTLEGEIRALPSPLLQGLAVQYLNFESLADLTQWIHDRLS
ncbi:MAG: DUF4351 domain-containing protein [Cyanobacteria bacterium SBC]|nr:DUF4351 domain-containing protein [Cyanobacteria bacterium SBC]